MRLILASRSPRRADLLRAAGFEFETLAVDLDETWRDGEMPDAYVRRLAGAKSALAQQRVSDRRAVVLGADTAVVVDGQILGKPEGDADARRMLGQLAGRIHHVLTGVSLRCGAFELAAVESTTVVLAPLTSDEMDWYVGSGEGCDKAGAYAIQGLASRFVTRIDGSYSNVVGLPIATVHALVAELRQSPPFLASTR